MTQDFGAESSYSLVFDLLGGIGEWFSFDKLVTYPAFKISLLWLCERNSVYQPFF